MKITSFDRKTVAELRIAVEAALKPLGEAIGVQFRAGHILFQTSNCTVKVEAALIGDGGEVKTKEAEDFRRMARFYGLKPEQLNQTFTDLRGARFKLVGLNIRARTKPFVIEDVAGKRFIAPEEMVLRGLGIEPRPPHFGGGRAE